MQMHRHAKAMVVAISALAWPLPAFAQSNAAAEVLFRDGRALLAAGQTAEACAKFGSSYKLEPKTGTLLNLALCHEAEGKLASAWSEFGAVAKRAANTPGDERAAFAQEKAAQLEEKLPKLILTASSFPSDGELEIDGQRADAGVLGTSLPLDPGDHKLVARAPGRAPWEMVIRAEVGKTLRVQVPALAPLGSGPARSAPADGPSGGVAPARSDTKDPVPGMRPILGWTALGVATVALGVGTYFGLRTFSKKNEGDAQCDGRLCSQAGLDLHEEASQAALVSTVAFGAGALGAGLGAYLLLSSKPAPTSVALSPLAGPQGFGLGARGAF